MPLTAKGEEILHSFKQEYGEEKGESNFYAAKNAGTIKGVDTAEGGAPAPDILTIPTSLTAAEINRRNKAYWYQQDPNPAMGEEEGGARGQDDLPAAANELAGELSTASGNPVKATPAPRMEPVPEDLQLEQQ